MLINFHAGGEFLDPNYRPPINFTDLDTTDSLDISEEDLYEEWNEMENRPIQRIIKHLSNFRIIVIIFGISCVAFGIVALMLVICAICCYAK